jgi:signal transduction histidine kinase
VLVAYAPRAPIFADSDLELVQLLADQAAIVLDSRALLEEATRIRARAEADRLKDEFLASVSHDLRNPLAAARGVAQVLTRRLERAGTVEPARLGAGLANIIAATGQMEALVDQLLDFARLQMGRSLTLERRETDLIAITRQVAGIHAAASDRHRLRLDVPDTPIVGWWDAGRLERVVQNLLGNALKYSPEGGEVVVRICEEAEGDSSGMRSAVLTVQDEGVGIPTADLPLVFRRFYRGTNVAGRIAGTGIGLAASRQVVEEHGGQITVASEEGRGSTFTVRLPMTGSDGSPAGRLAGADRGPTS